MKNLRAVALGLLAVAVSASDVHDLKKVESQFVVDLA